MKLPLDLLRVKVLELVRLKVKATEWLEPPRPASTHTLACNAAIREFRAILVVFGSCIKISGRLLQLNPTMAADCLGRFLSSKLLVQVVLHVQLPDLLFQSC